MDVVRGDSRLELSGGDGSRKQGWFKTRFHGKDMKVKKKWKLKITKKYKVKYCWYVRVFYMLATFIFIFKSWIVHFFEFVSRVP